MRMVLSVPDDFDFRNAVCSHGFFVLAPNRWDPTRQALETTIAVDETTAITVTLREAPGHRVAVSADGSVAPPHRQAVRAAVVRMLRLDEDLSPFHDRCRRSPSHREAAEMRFGRLLRSASLFEDIVKVICTCNVAWRQTVAMVENLVSHWGVPAASRHRSFPTPGRLAAASVHELQANARVGYRAASIHRLAMEVTTGNLGLAELEDHHGPTDELIRRLRRIHGVGDYAAGHLCMLAGYYDRLAVDTEMMRFLKSQHPRRRWTANRIKEHYAKWFPYQFLAYWFELWQDYTRHHGRADQWDPRVDGRQITNVE
ncbi:MAG: hypothetical protein HY718_22025 [Planctomycetes bacterium]|nr:hypothetical protein [Planctomycetota bacterium]